MTDSLVERLREASVGMGTRDPEDYTFAISTFVALEAAADRIEELEAALSEATKGLDYYEECMALRKENEKLLFCQQWIAEQAREIEELRDKVDRCGVKHPQDLKVAEAETPAPPSKPDQVPPQSTHVLVASVKQSLGFLQDDFLEHKQDTEQTLRDLLLHTRNLDQTLDSVVDRLRALEARIQPASPNVSYRYSDWSEEGSDPTPAFPLSEDKTPAPQHLEGEDLRRFQARPLGTAPLPKDRRSGKERRVLKSVERGHGSHYVGETDLYPNRREIARRLQDRQERWRG